ncbi:unnamed protein product [Wuchereria bancrofti]|uniref:Uncharacterized protein n=1 Tax=Wuchereria bancrofti TaxID=6293 RepID=A0A3P7ENM5_WUCBA|nr:unnamed protein product [Wuchereria bancrofti]
MAIVCCSRGNLYSRAFILITFQIIICNLISFTPHMIVVLPEILLNKNSSYISKNTFNNGSMDTPGKIYRNLRNFNLE